MILVSFLYLVQFLCILTNTICITLGLFEAFLESAPQFILQCSIVLRTGIVSKYPVNKIIEHFIVIYVKKVLFASHKLNCFVAINLDIM